MKSLWAMSALVAACCLALPASATAQVTTFYGDDDGFGVGETTGNLTDPDTSNQGAGEAPLTDLRLIGDPFVFPAFEPTGSFGAFTIPAGATITSVTLTLRTGAFDSGPAPVDGVPNTIVLDGQTVPATFINSFSTVAGNQIETLSVSLPASFFPLVADGVVSLAGTNISEDDGSGSFQVDFLRLDIVLAGVPTMGDGALALLGVLLTAAGAWFVRRQRGFARS